MFQVVPFQYFNYSSCPLSSFSKETGTPSGFNLKSLWLIIRQGPFFSCHLPVNEVYSTILPAVLPRFP